MQTLQAFSKFVGRNVEPILVDKLLMVPGGEIVKLWLCSRETTALARTVGCPTSTPCESSSSRGPAVSQEYRRNRRERRNAITATDI